MREKIAAGTEKFIPEGMTAEREPEEAREASEIPGAMRRRATEEGPGTGLDMFVTDKIRRLLLNRELVTYVIVGVLTTAVNYVVFGIVNEGLKSIGVNDGGAYKTAYVAAFIAAVIFAYWTNKLFVFRNRNMSPRYLLREFSGFVSARIASGVITFILMIVFVDLGDMNEYLALVLTSVVNLVFNYVASKFFIFKEKEKRP